MRERKSRRLSQTAGTGNPEPEILIRARPKPPFRNVHDSVKVREQETSRSSRSACFTGRAGCRIFRPAHRGPRSGGKSFRSLPSSILKSSPSRCTGILPKDGHLFAFALISNDKRHWPLPGISLPLLRPDIQIETCQTAFRRRNLGRIGVGASVYEVLPATGKTVEQLGKTNGVSDALSLGCFGQMWAGARLRHCR